MPEGKTQRGRCTSKSEGTGGLIPILQQYEGKLFPVQAQVYFRAHADIHTHTVLNLTLNLYTMHLLTKHKSLFL